MESISDTSTIARFLKHVTIMPSGCWEWRGERIPKGYGRFWLTRTIHTVAHRASYLLFVGPIPEGHFVLHRCDNPPCVNPEHLFTGTARDNMRDMMDKGRGIQHSGDEHWARKHPERIIRGVAFTPADRQARGERHGRYTHPERTARGEQSGRAKITAEQVRAIRRRYAAGGITQKALGIEYDLDQTAISLIIRRINWRELPD